MARIVLLLALIIGYSSSFAQTGHLRIVVRDSVHRSPITGATIKFGNKALATDTLGIAVLRDISTGIAIHVTAIGYVEKTVTITAFNEIEVLLVASEEELDEVIVESTRMNRSIAKIPTRIETLTEEIDEAAAMEPSRIAHLITHSTGIQVQTTSATSNGAVVRIQGLQGRYTKILKDGFPLYGGFSGSLDILQIPPLDLRQVEYIKGSASTLYGGGAIAGILNLLSKRGNKDEMLLHLNHSTIGSNDLNAFMSKKFGRFGFTNLASLQLHSSYDADEDGFTDMPEVKKFNFNPKLFYTPNDKTQIYFGGNIVSDQRKGGHVQAVKHRVDLQSFYLDEQKSTRATTQFQLQHNSSSNHRLTLKNSFSFFDRSINVNSSPVEETYFNGKQVSSFSELSYSSSFSSHAIVAGLSYTTENFKEAPIATSILRNEKHQTAGAFINHIWDATKFLSIESGLRTEWNQNESVYESDNGAFYVLPRISALIKYSPKFTSRFGGGLGYKPLTIFNEEAEPYGFKNVQSVRFQNVASEKSYGLNADVMYQSRIGDKMLLSINQMFFFNRISNPTIFDTSGGIYRFLNNPYHINSKGFETQIKYTVGKFTLFVGYTYTDASFDVSGKGLLLPLVPKHSIKGDLLFVEESKWRIGWDYEYKSSQRLSNNRFTRDLFSTGVVIERTLGNFVLFFNAENITDVRQTRYENIRSAPYNTPQFTEIWAPLDGRFLNFGLKLTL
jgi:outer membrane receptor for ferrienterochelin and colicins